MGVVSLLDPLPVITADAIRNLRAPDGSAPCAEGLRAGLKWIGARALPLDEAQADVATKRSVQQFVGWALAALGFSGDGYGYGDGSGDGSGYGDGDGYGYGYGDGSGDGSGDGYGYGSGYGYGDGYGDGSGDGYGSGYGSGSAR